MAPKLTVVISQAQGKNPIKRQLEEGLAARLLMEPGIDVSVVPHVYDMSADHTGMLFLRSVKTHMVMLGWLYPRALRWVLDRQGVRGQEGISLIVPEDESDADDEEQPELQGIGSVNIPDRRLYCIDLRSTSKIEEYVEELRRIQQENAQPLVNLLGWISGSPNETQMERFLNPLPIVPSVGGETGGGGDQKRTNGNGHAGAAPTDSNANDAAAATAPGELHNFADEEAKRRWYPVIDYSRCTNCMECIDFCLFGVYGVDALDRILVEEQDNCKKGCPACSRVCPENAIIFPHHKSPAIAGADGEVGGIKIDLSRLFGGDDGASALETAVLERDRELILAGRDAVGMSVGIKSRQPDELDDLMNALDSLEF